jgi:acetyl-CoA carboxylase biotin carboxyl carrier protein
MAEGAREHAEQPLDDEFGLSAVREILRLISETDVTEIQIERGDTRLHIKRGAVAQHAASFHAPPPLMAGPQAPNAASLPPVAPFQQHPAERAAGASPAASADPEPLPAGQAITAPMVGTFYAAPSTKDPPYVQEGDTIHPGDRVGIIETMKMMNEIESEVAGRIVRVLVQNGQPVEYGQPLIIVEPELGVGDRG